MVEHADKVQPAMLQPATPQPSDMQHADSQTPAEGVTQVGIAVPESTVDGAADPVPITDTTASQDVAAMAASTNPQAMDVDNQALNNEAPTSQAPTLPKLQQVLATPQNSQDTQAIHISLIGSQSPSNTQVQGPPQQTVLEIHEVAKAVQQATAPPDDRTSHPEQHPSADGFEKAPPALDNGAEHAKDGADHSGMLKPLLRPLKTRGKGSKGSLPAQVPGTSQSPGLEVPDVQQTRSHLGSTSYVSGSRQGQKHKAGNSEEGMHLSRRHKW